MMEETVFVEVDGSALGDGENWKWLGDLNVVALRRGLTCEAKAQVLEDITRWWRRAHLRLVQSA